MIFYGDDDDLIDCDIGFLEEALITLDTRLDYFSAKIKESCDPHRDGLFERAEHVIGLGFVACQKYLVSTYGPAKISKTQALTCGPIFNDDITVVKIIDATANYWKHNDEWDTIGFFHEIHSEWATVLPRVKTNLSNRNRKTLANIETATPWADYTCSNVLAAVIGDREFALHSLIPLTVEWRNDFAMHPTFGERLNASA